MFDCGADCQSARRLLTGAPGGLPTRRRLPACPTGKGAFSRGRRPSQITLHKRLVRLASESLAKADLAGLIRVAGTFSARRNDICGARSVPYPRFPPAANARETPAG